MSCRFWKVVLVSVEAQVPREAHSETEAGTQEVNQGLPSGGQHWKERGSSSSAQRVGFIGEAGPG